MTTKTSKNSPAVPVPEEESRPKSDGQESGRADDARVRILEAALSEFSAHGLAGARTEAIAAAAGVNKALLYYYFQSKENLYTATIEKAAEKALESSLAVFKRDASPGERLLRMALNHFDRILSQQEFQSLLQQEMIRRHQASVNPRKSSKQPVDAVPIIAKRVFGPMTERFQRLACEGIASGELIQVDWMQMVLASVGANVFYFVGSSVWREVSGEEPFSPQALAARRTALVEYLGQSVFIDRRRGAKLAAKVLADTPMPEIKPRPGQGHGNWGKG